MIRAGVRARIADSLAALDRREPRYGCSACGLAPAMLSREAEDHLVFAHGLGRDRAEEMLARDVRETTGAVA